MSKKKLFLLDGMALAYRAHFAFIKSNLKNSEGIPTGPILGFTNTLIKLLEEEEPTHIAVAWDTHAPTFRHKLDEEYKANRPPQPEELTVGIPIIKEIVEKFGMKNLEEDGYEADDIIGTLAAQANEEDVNVYLVTPDKDFMQLVHDHITMYKPDNKNGGFVLIDREGVREYFGVYPEQVTDVLALIGDTSDNIPGVPGIGKKGAPTLINRFGSLEKAIEEASKIKSKSYREGLLDNRDKALHAKYMVTINTSVPDVEDWKTLSWGGPPDKMDLGRFFKKLDFRTLTKKYLGESAEGQPDLFSGPAETGSSGSAPVDDGLRRFDASAVEYRFVPERKEIEAMAEELSGKTALCFDTETDSSDPVLANLVGISFSAEPGKAWYVPVGVEGALPAGEVSELLQPLFQNPDSVLIAHNYKYDYIVLTRAGFSIGSRPAFDTMVAAYLLDSSQALKMDALAKTYLGYDPIPIETLIGSGRKQKTMDEIPAEEVANYACEDADVTFQLYEQLKEKLKEDELIEIAEKVDFPLMQVLGDMEVTGIALDTEMLGEFSRQLDEDLKHVESKIFSETGEEFNLNSPQQLGEVLFEKMGIPAKKKTKTGQYSTAESVLTDLAAAYEVPGLVLDYRSLSKLKSTYADALPKLVNPETGRLHTNFNQTVAATGRLSSSNPNLQNIPIRTERGREIRKAFVPEKGYRLLAADYSQVELRVIASISGDENMIQAFREGEDIHSRTAVEIFGLSGPDEVTPDHRRKAKEVNFGIPYGVSAYGLASRLGISNSEGKEMIDQYFERFPGIHAYIEETTEFAREHGYVKTLMGRRRYIPEIRSKNWNVRGFAERTAINMPIQGTAADIIKLAMIRIDGYLTDENCTSRMLLQVHDELVFEIHDDELEVVPQAIKDLMESAAKLDVPLKIDMGIAENWLKAH
ncbi:MAG: DNA polymerase I [Balneolaceae bacterium]